MSIRELTYTVSFTTPAFLGNAKQHAQWRTPPFKALLRQWWRIVKAPQVNFSVAALREGENQLFGVAAEERGTSRQSRVRLRLQHWTEGLLDTNKWPRNEIRDVAVGQGRSIPADVYIGYGPVRPLKNSQPAGPARAFIAPKSMSNEIRIGFARDVTDEQIAEVRAALALANWFGGIGSRSRNGWGSVVFSGNSLPGIPRSVGELTPHLRSVDLCLGLDWPHAIGLDQHGPLIWSGNCVKNWREAVFVLATVRRAIRTTAKTFGKGRDISANQLVAYPVTQSGNSKWGDAERMAGSLRLKVVESDQGLIPLAVHLPCAVPAILLQKLDTSDRDWIADKQNDIWCQIHRTLDGLMTRFGGAK